MSLWFAVLHVLGILSLSWCTSGSELNVATPISCGTRAVDLSDTHLLVLCPANCSLWSLSVFGSGVYASISSICGAAIHRGIIGLSGGPVEVHGLQGRTNYLSSYAHGVQSQSLSQWSASFTVARTISLPLEVSSQTSSSATVASGAAKKPVKKIVKKPPPATAHKDCPVDMALLLDSSYNIGQRRFNLQKNFVSKLATMLKVGTQGPHVGVVQTSETPRTEFYLTNYTTAKDVTFAIKEIPYIGGNTNTGLITSPELRISYERMG